jgi:hypothetical protein
MDYQFWASLLVSSIIGIGNFAVAYKSLSLQKQQAQAMKGRQTTGSWRPSNWLLITVALMVLCWIPYILYTVNAKGNITPDNVKDNVRRWADNRHLVVQELDDPATRFTLVLITKPQGKANELKIYIKQFKNESSVLNCSVGISVGDFPQNLSEAAVQRIADKVEIAITRFVVGYSVNPVPLSWRIETEIPINNLTDSAFLDKLQGILNCAITAWDTAKLAINDETTK